MDIKDIKTQDSLTAFTDPTSDRRNDLLHDKVQAVFDFFVWVNKSIQIITPGDVKKWQEEFYPGYSVRKN